MDKKFAKGYKKSIIPDRLYWHIKDILLNINKRPYLKDSESVYKNYLKKGDEEYNKTSKDKFGTSATIRHLKEAKNYYNLARMRAHNLGQEQKARQRLGGVRNTLSILERINPRKEKVSGLLSNLDKRFDVIMKGIKDLQKIQKTVPIFILFSFVLSLFFLSMNFTGAVVGNVQQDFSILGILFFVSGLTLTFFYVRSKRRFY